jgi:hypothetical protein
VLFALVCTALLGSALAFGLNGNDLGKPAAAPDHRGGEGTAAAAAAFAERSQHLHREVRTAARSFVAAFLRYEVGELGAGVTSTLRAFATASFSRELLANRPQPTAGEFPHAAALGQIAVAFVSAIPPRAVISGSARRGRSSEQFSFVFERRGRAWLASGPGQ